MTINPEQQKLIDFLIESGIFSSADEVINIALHRLVEDQEQDLEQLRQSVRSGLDQLERGEYTDYDDDGLKALAGRIKARGLDRLRAEGRLND